MIILPRNEPLVLPPVPALQWRSPSAAQPKDMFGQENVVRFRVRLLLHDGHPKWAGWFNDRNDADAFLWAAIRQIDGNIPIPAPLFGMLDDFRGDYEYWPGLTYDFATQVFISSGAGSGNQTYTVPSDWTAANTIQTIGGGASGGVRLSTGSNGEVTGGGGGAWNQIVNLALTPSSSVTYNIASGGAGVTGSVAGNAGNDTWFNGTTLAASSVGSKGGTAGKSSNTQATSSAGGVGTSGVGSSRFNGGASGNGAGWINSATGGGGAAGPNGAGTAGTNITASNLATKGGNGDSTSGGTGSNGGNPSADGGAGAEWDATHGSGGASGGGMSTTTGGNSGNGGLYGAGSGGATGLSGARTSGNGGQGIVYISYTSGGATYNQSALAILGTATTFQRSVFKGASISSPANTAINKGIIKSPIGAALSSSVTIVAGRAFLRSIASSLSTTVAISKSVLKPFAIPLTTATLWRRSIAKKIGATVASTTVWIAGRYYAKAVAAAVTSTTVWKRTIGKLVRPSLSTTTTVKKGISFKVTVAASAVASVIQNATLSFLGALVITVEAVVIATAYFGKLWKDNSDTPQTWNDTTENSPWTQQFPGDGNWTKED